MKRVLLILVLVLAAAGAGFWFGRGHESGKDPDDAASTQPAEDEKPVADVTVTPLKRAAIARTITAYGSVVAQAGNVRVLSVPFEARVVKAVAVAGQQVPADAEVIRVEASPDALVSLEEAK